MTAQSTRTIVEFRVTEDEIIAVLDNGDEIANIVRFAQADQGRLFVELAPDELLEVTDTRKELRPGGPDTQPFAGQW